GSTGGTDDWCISRLRRQDAEIDCDDSQFETARIEYLRRRHPILRLSGAATVGDLVQHEVFGERIRMLRGARKELVRLADMSGSTNSALQCLSAGGASGYIGIDTRLIEDDLRLRSDQRVCIRRKSRGGGILEGVAYGRYRWRRRLYIRNQPCV